MAGVAFLYAARRSLKKCKPGNDDQRVGIDIVRKAMETPLRQIASNAGYDGSIVIGKVLESKDEGFGFDAQEGEYGDLFKAGVIDPVKMVRTALQDAASVAGLLITTEAMVAEKPEKPKNGAAPGGGMPRHGRDGLLTKPNRLFTMKGGRVRHGPPFLLQQSVPARLPVGAPADPIHGLMPNRSISRRLPGPKPPSLTSRRHRWQRLPATTRPARLRTATARFRRPSASIVNQCI